MVLDSRAQIPPVHSRPLLFTDLDSAGSGGLGFYCDYAASVVSHSPIPTLGTVEWSADCGNLNSIPSWLTPFRARIPWQLTFGAFSSPSAPPLVPSPPLPPSPPSPPPPFFYSTLEVSGFVACAERAAFDAVYSLSAIDALFSPVYVSNGGLSLYHDVDCDGEGFDTSLYDSATKGPRWILTDRHPVDPSRQSDLDNDGWCIYVAQLMSADPNPPLGKHMWKVDCDGAWVDMLVKVTEASPAAPPAPPSSPDPPRAPPSPSMPPSMPTVLFSFDVDDPSWQTGETLEDGTPLGTYY